MTTTVKPLTFDEQQRVMHLLDRCSNRAGSFSLNVGARRFRRRLFKMLDEPTVANWRNTHHVVISSKPSLTLGMAVNLFTDYDSGQGAPTRRQLLLAISEATRLHKR